ncbi:MAG TPA: AAA family ATPase [Candidatus Saccharimonadales bacterium]|nr:AAA family ATPase [Candidatus Saccharimonadales bacterium]
MSTGPTLIMIRGVPGSGKSYLAAGLQKAIGKEKATMLDPDKIDKTSEEYRIHSEALTKDGVDEKFHPYRFLRARAYGAITAHKIVIWNQAFIDFEGFKKTVDNLQAFATEHDTKLPTLVVEVEVGGHIAKARVADRAKQGGHDVPEEAFDRFIEQYRSFSEQGYDIVTINGEDDGAKSVAVVQKALAAL